METKTEKIPFSLGVTPKPCILKETNDCQPVDAHRRTRPPGTSGWSPPSRRLRGTQGPLPGGRSPCPQSLRAAGNLTLRNQEAGAQPTQRGWPGGPRLSQGHLETEGREPLLLTRLLGKVRRAAGQKRALLRCQVYEFPTVAITNDHKLSGLNSTHPSFTVLAARGQRCFIPQYSGEGRWKPPSKASRCISLALFHTSPNSDDPWDDIGPTQLAQDDFPIS